MPHVPCGSGDGISILLWVSQLDMRQADAMLFSTHCELTADVLRLVVDADGCGLPAMEYLIQYDFHALCQ
ncbi:MULTISPECIES: hypothetical protein [Pseudomonas]|uniref:hypothetical protein n=1 Tax=Pseudomonas TaxID=286 RepID=UPI00300166C3